MFKSRLYSKVISVGVLSSSQPRTSLEATLLEHFQLLDTLCQKLCNEVLQSFSEKKSRNEVFAILNS